jgi:hypothetical protein
VQKQNLVIAVANITESHVE